MLSLRRAGMARRAAVARASAARAPARPMGLWADFKDQLRSEIAKDEKLKEDVEQLSGVAERAAAEKEAQAEKAAELAEKVREQSREAAAELSQRVGRPASRLSRRALLATDRGIVATYDAVAGVVGFVFRPVTAVFRAFRPVWGLASSSARLARQTAKQVYESETPAGQLLRRAKVERDNVEELLMTTQLAAARQRADRRYEKSAKDFEHELAVEKAFDMLWEGKAEEVLEMKILTETQLKFEAEQFLEDDTEESRALAERLLEGVKKQQEAELDAYRDMQEHFRKQTEEEHEDYIKEAMARDAAAKAEEEAEARRQAAEEAGEEWIEEEEEAGVAGEGPTDLQVVEKKQTVWERRLEQMTERVQDSSATQAARKAKARVMRSEAVERLQDKLDDMQERLEHSQDPYLWKMRELSDKVNSETEHGVAITQLRRVDPNFREDRFLTEMKEHYVPNVVRAFLRGDMNVLNRTMTGNASRVVRASMMEREAIKVRYDDRILDIAHVDLAGAMIHPEEDTPVLQLTFMCQHVNCLRNYETGEIAQGSESEINQVAYSLLLQRDPYDEEYGWKAVEFSYQKVFSLSA